nr:MarR family winged helix-turn-helix transcriptional regulator [Micromonospora sp. DSM 115978]
VERASDPSDRRATLIRLTPLGRERYERSRAARLDGLAGLTESWPEADRRSLGALLAKLNDAIAVRERRRRASGATRPDQPAAPSEPNEAQPV